MRKIIITIIAFIVVVSFANAKYLYQYEPDWDIRADRAVEEGIVTDADFYVGSYEQNIALLGHYQNDEDQAFGITIPTVVAVFETSLRYSITGSSTTMTLVSGTDGDGTTLSGTYGFVLNEGGTNEEFVLATCTDTACTFVTRGISVIDGETSVYARIKEHRRGNSVKITNYPVLAILARTANGDEGFPNTLYYASQPSMSTTTAIATKYYVDNVGAGGFTSSNVDTSYGIRVFDTSPETVGIASSTLWGLRFDNDGGLQIATSTGSGVYIDTDNTIKVATTSDFTWTGDHSFSGNTTSTGAFHFSGDVSGATAFGGDGSDGALAITTGTTTIDLSSATTTIKNYSSISIADSSGLTVSNPAWGGSTLILKSKGACTIAGYIDVSEDGAESSSASYGTIGYLAGGSDAVGSAAGTASTHLAGYSLDISGKVIKSIAGAGGGEGELYQSDVFTDAGRGGGVIIIECAGAITFTGNINASGENGTNGATGETSKGGSGGGGGGSGGTVVIIYNSLTTNTGTITANGGDGGDGGAGGSGTNTVAGQGGGSGANHQVLGGNGGAGGSSAAGAAGSAGNDGRSGTSGGAASSGGAENTTTAGSRGGGGGGGGGAGGEYYIVENTEF